MLEHKRTHTLLRAIILIIAAITVNITLGHLVQYVFKWPLFLDSIGTILVGALLGPLAGAATGVMSNLIWGYLYQDPAIIPYSLVAAFIGWAAGYAVAHGAFERFRSVVLTGLLVGIGAALLSAPITAYLNGGVTGGGTDYLTSYLSATGANLIQAATIQGLVSDPLDKVLSFALAWLLWRPLHIYFMPTSVRGSQMIDRMQGYGIAVIASILCVLWTFIFLPAFERGTFHIFYVAVLITAWRGGLGPALFMTGVGVLANILFLVSPYYDGQITLEDWLRVGIFVVVSLLIAYIGYLLESNKRELQKLLRVERESQARIRAITDSVNEALVLVAPDGRILDANRLYVEMFGVPLNRFVGQRLADLQTMFDQVFEQSEELYQLALASSADMKQELSRLLVQIWPERRELQLYSTPVRDKEGFLGRLFIFRDVTREREIDRMKTEFVSLVSHELRTPLTSIKGFTEMVLDGDAGEINDEVEEYLGIVYNNAERLVALVNDLLDLSRIESGRIRIKSEPVNLEAIVQSVVDTMKQKIKEKQQSLTVKIDPASTSVSGDRDKLVQVLTNYLSNAYKYTQAGGNIQIIISNREGFAHVAVSDDGFGISAGDQEKLFTRFYRVDNSMTREVGGTGLGLSIVKQLIELHGGQVGVESEPGRGSTFWFTLPLLEAASVGLEDTLQSAPELQAKPLGATILIIEDDPAIANLISHHLQKASYKVSIAHTADEAIANIEKNPPDLITLDIDLPDMQGNELIQRLHDDRFTRDIPILITSMYVDSQTGTQFGAYGLLKPIDREELLITVAEMLSEAHKGPVLIIDDDADIRTLLSTALEKQGYQIQTAATGEIGLELANQLRPALILLDMRLPGMDGFSVLRVLKESGLTADIPVIAMTGSQELNINARARVLALGASDFIAKPFDMNRLVEEVHIFAKP
jgi:PAS domain S-box-containing protein